MGNMNDNNNVVFPSQQGIQSMSSSLNGMVNNVISNSSKQSIMSSNNGSNSDIMSSSLNRMVNNGSSNNNGQLMVNSNNGSNNNRMNLSLNGTVNSSNNNGQSMMNINNGSKSNIISQEQQMGIQSMSASLNGMNAPDQNNMQSCGSSKMNMVRDHRQEQQSTMSHSLNGIFQQQQSNFGPQQSMMSYSLDGGIQNQNNADQQGFGRQQFQQRRGMGSMMSRSMNGISPSSSSDSDGGCNNQVENRFTQSCQNLQGMSQSLNGLGGFDAIKNSNSSFVVNNQLLNDISTTSTQQQYSGDNPSKCSNINESMKILMQALQRVFISLLEGTAGGSIKIYDARAFYEIFTR